MLGAALSGEASLSFAQISPGPLSKAHASLEGALNCFKCHGLRDTPMDEHCLDCHTDVAFLKDRGRGLHGQRDLSTCTGCHPEHAGADFDLIQWKEGSSGAFDHSRAGWPLSGKHASLACAQCHQTRFRTSPSARLSRRSDPSQGWIGLDPACLSCHEDTHRGALGDQCITCHTAAGWKPARSFDHAKTAFPLTGKHAPLACAQCHLAPGLDLSRDAQGRPVPIYKPLPHGECAACHRDPHEGRLGGSCSGCHATSSFKEVAKASFDHQRTRFPLAGAHRAVSCESCHGSGPARKARPSFDRCGSCHGDPHAGSATLAGKPADCASCHAVDGWQKSVFTVGQHASTGYPLQGRHAGIECRSCHTREGDPARAAALGKARVRIRPEHDQCSDCHADAHAGQLASRAGGGACESCHAVEGWKPARFTVADHRSASFPLEGAHEKTACADCHGPARPGLPPLPGGGKLGKAGIAFQLDEEGCADCHLDPHAGRFGGRKASAVPVASGSCLDCHGMKAFRPSTIDAATHQRFAFPVEGAHRALPCVECHEQMKAPAGSSSLRLATGKHPKLEFGQARSRCEDCHRGPHGDQFVGAPERTCATCHGIEAFRPASRFDHDRDAAFALKGAHARVACERCHETRMESGIARVIYRPLPTRCDACHVSAPAGGAAPS